MNIFILDTSPKVCARYTCNKHVVKMIIETAQLLCTAHHLLDDPVDKQLMKPTHANHGCAIWARETRSNYNWLYTLFTALCNEYTYRYNKVHSVDTKYRAVLWYPPKNIVNKPITTPYLAMPEYCKKQSTVASYRNYYQKEKYEFAEWKKRPLPFFMVDKIEDEPAENWAEISQICGY